MTDPAEKTRSTEDELADELAAQAAAGSSASFERLVALIGPRLLRYLAGRIGDAHAAEDALQETLLKAYRHLGQYDVSRSVSAWLFAIATREVVGHWRSRKVSLPLEYVDPLDNSAQPVLNAMLEREQREGLWATASSVLNEEQFGALWMRYVEGMATRDIADALGRSTGSVKVMLHRACRKLMDSPAVAADRPLKAGQAGQGGKVSIETL